MEISSKNAGSFFLTFDVVFDDAERYRRVKASGALTRERIATPRGMRSAFELGFHDASRHAERARQGHERGIE